MAEDQQRERIDLEDREEYVDPNLGTNTYSGYNEETAAEVAPNLTMEPRRVETGNNDDAQTVTGGAGLGWLALALSIISLFVMPIVMGAGGIVLGFIARARGAKGTGAWAIGIGAVSIIVGMFILPFL